MKAHCAGERLPAAKPTGLLRALNSLVHDIEGTGAWAPWLFLGLFVAASALMIWRLEAMSDRGFEGTVLGTLIMPYCSGIGNLVFAFVLGRKGGPGAEVMTNALVNNVTNMTLLIGLPAVIWGLSLMPAAKGKSRKRGNQKEHQINRLSLLLTLTAVLFFTGAVWALARDGKLDFGDGLVLVGLFLFWQCFHVFDVLKSNVRQNKSFNWRLPLDLALLVVGAVGTYLSIAWLVEWLSKIPTGFISADNMGWLSGWLMVLPNALLALYYGWRGNPEVVYTSQVGDGHICIPLCVGIFALFHPLTVPAMFQTGMFVLAGATAVHFVCVMVFGGLPRVMGWVMMAAYGYFIYQGLLR
ncbi:MAG: sodium:calcium symporter [Verrucomicrobia bacterium]|nr:sodium:calcium symporter [Verrucomicrobiota bacterium]